ncbi:MAG TPA: sugar ABC transporter substrate-binding protein [Variovorax sp.]|nr:sugar ABC transporter substrate-binding protein [Variovorax sp.]
MLTRLLCCLVLGLGCAASASGQALSVWVHSGPGPERDAYVASVRAFNEAQALARDNVRAELVPLPEADYNEAVNKAARERRLPCVLEFDGPNVASYAAAGHLVPLERFERMAQIQNAMLASLVRQGTVDGKLYSVGQYDSGLALWGNRQLLAQAGVRIPARVDDGWTLAEFEDALRKLKAAGVASPLDMKFNYGVGEWFTYGFAPIIQGFGGDLVDRKTLRTAQGTLNSPASVKAMATLQGWIRAGYVDPTPADDKAFVNGRSALSWVGHWVYSDYKKALGDKLVLMPLPRFGGKTVTGSGSWNFGIAASCAQPQAAAKFLEHLMSRAEILRVTEVNGAVPGTGAAMVYSRAYGPGGELRLYADQLLAGLARVRPATAHYPTISRSFALAVSQVAKGADPQRSLDQAAAAIDRNLADEAAKAAGEKKLP